MKTSVNNCGLVVRS